MEWIKDLRFWFQGGGEYPLESPHKVVCVYRLRSDGAVFACDTRIQEIHSTYRVNHYIESQIAAPRTSEALSLKDFESEVERQRQLMRGTFFTGPVQNLE